MALLSYCNSNLRRLFRKLILDTDPKPLGDARQFSSFRWVCQKSEADAGETVSGNQKEKVPQIDPQTSLRYMESEAYSAAYGNKPVWVYYRRNYKNAIPPPTRKTCIRAGIISTGSPCPICRDEYLVFHYKNTKLLEQFISPYTGEVLPAIKTGICQKQQKKLLVEILKARDYGYIEDKVMFREYNYSEFLDDALKKKSTSSSI